MEIKLPSNLNVEEAAKISNNLREKLIEGIESLQYVAIQIISHEVETGFYKPTFGRGFGWQNGVDLEKKWKQLKEGVRAVIASVRNAVTKLLTNAAFLTRPLNVQSVK